MAQYQQKTDSREFEVANPGQDSRAFSGDSIPDPTDLGLRLWGPDWSDQSGSIAQRSLTWKTDSVFVYMIADLVAASSGRIAEESTGVMSAHFETSRQALVAARRIQAAILEFLACRPGGSLAAAILIHHPAVSPGGFSREMVRAALRQAKPGQILLGESLAQRMRNVPGVELAAVPALASGGEGQAALAELIWTTPEQLARLRSSIPEQPTTRIEQTPTVGATMMVISPVQDSGRQGTAAADSVLRTGSETDALVREEKWDHGPGSRDFLNPETSLLEGLDTHNQRPVFTRSRIILGLAGVALVAAVITVFYPANKPQVRPPLQTQPAGAAANNPGEHPRVPTAQTPVATAQPETKPAPSLPEVPPAQAPPSQASQIQPGALDTQTKVPAVASRPALPPKSPSDLRPKNPSLSDQPVSIEEIGGVSQTDIPTLLRMAHDDAGAGRYDKARGEYRKVLQLRPNNPDAKDGLHRLDLIQSDKDNQ